MDWPNDVGCDSSPQQTFRSGTRRLRLHCRRGRKSSKLKLFDEWETIRMADWTLKGAQLRGKVRRFIQASVVRENTDELLAVRKGECNRCGACCKILFRCPFLAEDAEGQFRCRIYAYRFSQCRLFPLHAEDLGELAGQCSYTFDGKAAPTDADAPAPVPAD